MHVLHVDVHVKPECVGAFIEATTQNAMSSLQETGVARFDVVQQHDDPTRFRLVEVYRTPEDPAKHKETAHYAAWAEAVGPMLAEPRSKIVYGSVFPDDEAWD